MSMSMRGYIGRCLQVTLRPTVRYLISHGFDAKDFAEVAKLVYVDVATAEHGAADKPASGSAVARLTGLTRREVARLRKASQCHSDHDVAELESNVTAIELARFYEPQARHKAIM